MKKTQIFAVGTAGLVVGVAGGFGLALYSGKGITSAGTSIAQQYQVGFEAIASRTGVPKPPDKVLTDAQNVLALNTVLVGQHFAQIKDEQTRSEVVRISRLIDANPKLHAQMTNQSARWASEARRCILDHAAQPEQVVSCVRESPNAMKAGQPKLEGRVADL